MWNSPWPSACAGYPSGALGPAAVTRWGVRANAGAAFGGAAVTTLYNHPGAYTLGDWPSLWPNGSVAANGGIPQRGNLTRHLARVATDVVALFPDPEHAGLVVIDWEEWQPYLNPRATTAYANASFAAAGGDVAAAVAAWNASSLEFMARTLETAVALRPRAAWGFYGLVGCYGQWDVAAGGCAAASRARNDALAPLWRAGSALFPSIYSACRYSAGAGQSAPPHCLPDASQANATEAQKIALTLQEVQRVNGGGRGGGGGGGGGGGRVPVWPFTWYTLYTHTCAKPPPVGLGHCPLMRAAPDLDAEFALARHSGAADGLVVWGSNGDVRAGTDDCAEFGAYLNETLGPLLQSLVNP